MSFEQLPSFFFFSLSKKRRVESRHLEAIEEKETRKKKMNIGEELSEGLRDQGKVIKQCLACEGLNFELNCVGGF